MLKRVLIASTIAMQACLTGQLAAQTPLGTDFTYQGQLKGSGMPAISTADFQFALFDAESGGSQIGATLSKPNVGIVNGLFTILVDFGAAAMNGDAHWLRVSVRSPAGAGSFAILTPRQPVTAAPYSLQTRGITVDASDRVGIGTQTPAKKLTVAGDMELGTSSGDYRHMRIGGGNSDGFLYGSFPSLGDGIHLGYNYLADAAGNGQVIHTDGGTSRLSVGYGAIRLAASGAGGAPPVNRVTVDQSGLTVNVGDITIPPKLRSYTIHGTELMLPAGADAGGIVYDDAGLRSTGLVRIFYASPHLPDGATVAALELLGNDGMEPSPDPDSVRDMLCVLGRTTFTGVALEMASVASVTGGHVWQTTDILAPVIDNDTHAYWVRVRLYGGVGEESGHRVYAIRIIYEINKPLP